MKVILSILILPTFLVSCKPFTNPEVQRIENIKILQFTGTEIKCKLDMVFYNANNFDIDLAATKLSAFVFDKKLATIDQQYNVTMPAKSEFVLPLTINLDLSKLSESNKLEAIQRGLEIMNSQNVKVLLKGNIILGNDFAKVPIPIHREEVINL